MNGLTDLAKLKVHLKISDADTTQDVLLEQLIDGVSQAARRITGRDFNSATRTEYYDGTGQESLYTRHRPLTAVTSLYLDASGYAGQAAGGFAASTQLTQGTDFWVPMTEATERNAGCIRIITNPFWESLVYSGGLAGQGRAVWPVGQGNIKLTYTAGYRVIPDDLAMAVHFLCAQVRTSLKVGGPVSSETFGRYSYTLLTGNEGSPELMTARSILAGYTEVYT